MCTIWDQSGRIAHNTVMLGDNSILFASEMMPMSITLSAIPVSCKTNANWCRIPIGTSVRIRPNYLSGIIIIRSIYFIQRIDYPCSTIGSRIVEWLIGKWELVFIGMTNELCVSLRICCSAAHKSYNLKLFHNCTASWERWQYGRNHTEAGSRLADVVAAL